MDKDERPVFGQKVNEMRTEFEQLLSEKQEIFKVEEEKKSIDQSSIDVTMPGFGRPLGSSHPLSVVEKQIVKIFQSLGFSIEEGPEVETDYYNFEALNFPPNHPARDMQDSFFVSGDRVLRTHTSPVQIRTMEKVPPTFEDYCPRSSLSS